jgi:hypothetical protein
MIRLLAISIQSKVIEPATVDSVSRLYFCDRGLLDRQLFLILPFVNVSADVLLLPLRLAQSSFHHASIAGRENLIILPPTLVNGIG